jgi:hypothetical protein
MTFFEVKASSHSFVNFADHFFSKQQDIVANTTKIACLAITIFSSILVSPWFLAPLAILLSIKTVRHLINHEVNNSTLQNSRKKSKTYEVNQYLTDQTYGQRALFGVCETTLTPGGAKTYYPANKLTCLSHPVIIAEAPGDEGQQAYYEMVLGQALDNGTRVLVSAAPIPDENLPFLALNESVEVSHGDFPYKIECIAEVTRPQEPIYTQGSQEDGQAPLDNEAKYFIRTLKITQLDNDPGSVEIMLRQILPNFIPGSPPITNYMRFCELIDQYAEDLSTNNMIINCITGKDRSALLALIYDIHKNGIQCEDGRTYVQELIYRAIQIEKETTPGAAVDLLINTLLPNFTDTLQDIHKINQYSSVFNQQDVLTEEEVSEESQELIHSAVQTYFNAFAICRHPSMSDY